MKHQCNCGEIAEVEDKGKQRVATCKACGSYYIYSHQIIEPKEEVIEEVEEVIEEVPETVEEKPQRRKAERSGKV